MNRISRKIKFLCSCSPIQFKNRFLLLYDIKSKNLTPESYPWNMTLALSNVCNYLCPMCSVHNLRTNKVKKVTNNISLTQLISFSDLLRCVEQLNFMGFFGESVLNPEFIPIIRYLKKEYQISLFFSTNGYGVNRKIQDTLIESKLDSMTFSIHAVQPQTYAKLQGDHFETVINNLRSLNQKKIKANSTRPKITIAYALNKINIKEATDMLEIAGENGIDKLFLYHYRDYGISEFSLDNDTEYANAQIDHIYEYAKNRNLLHLLPGLPPYYKDITIIKEDQPEKPCYKPWTSLQMRSSYSHNDSLYLGCCNTFNAFLFNYKEHINHYGKLEFQKIWNHPVLQYLRKTVNTHGKVSRNPLCTYCKSQQRDYLKNTDNKKNYEIKLSKISDFFNEFSAYNKNADLPSIQGLQILYSEDDELRKLA